jgi:hypothetical protein
MQTQINAAYNLALSSLNTSNAAISQGLTLGTAAATTEVASRIGSLSSDATGDGSYTAIVLGLDRNNYNPSAGPLAPGANTNAIGGSDPGVGIYIQPNRGPTGATGAMYPTWGTVTPYGTTTATISLIDNAVSPYNLQSAAYANDLMQTYCTGGSTSAASTSACVAYATATGADISNSGTIGGVNPTQNALYWNDPGTTEQPPGHWLSIVNTIIDEAAAHGNPLTLEQQAQLSMMVSQATFDAGISAWDVKYDWNLWRPITAITSCGLGVWNNTLASYGFTCDASWKSLIATPPHPDFVAGHPDFSAAAATVLSYFFNNESPGFTFSNTSDAYCNAGGYTVISDGAGGFTCRNNTTLALDASLYVAPITETFGNFTAASDAATDSRVSGGIHTGLAVNDAANLGAQIGTIIANQNGFTTIPEPASILVILSGLLGIGYARRRRV